MRRSFLLFPALACGACALTDEGDVPVRIAIDVAALTGATQGDFNSVMDRVDLVITDVEGGRQTVSRGLDPGEFDPAFEVEVPEGLTTFTVTVVSTDGLPLYEGLTTSTIDRDGFEVTIVPQPVRGVLIASPRQPVFNDLGDSEYAATMTVRNAGSTTLQWRVPPPTATNYGLQCQIQGDDVASNCLEFTPLVAQGQVTISVRIITRFPLPPEVEFDSSVGTFAVPTGP